MGGNSTDLDAIKTKIESRLVEIYESEVREAYVNGMRKDITYFRTSKGVRIDVELLSHKAPYDFLLSNIPIPWKTVPVFIQAITTALTICSKRW